MKKLFVGTAGWSYKDWIGSFYPKAQSSSFDWLEFYSHYFNCVEVNASYYTYIAPHTVENWVEKVATKNDFEFVIKLHQDFTHKRKFTQQNINAITENLDILKNSNRLGGVLIQFPLSFQLNKVNAEHVKELVEIFSGYDKFIEVRHSSWLIERFTNFLGQNKASLCTIDQPVIGSAVPFAPIKAGEHAYIRLHGRNEDAWAGSFKNIGKEQTYEQQSERYNYLYSPGELAEIESKVNEIIDTVNKVFVILNNHPKGNAVANAFELFHLLSERLKIPIPDTTLKAYPRLAKIKAG
jgi:uncharacterized protein YecE (DUF72 family)